MILVIGVNAEHTGKFLGWCGQHKVRYRRSLRVRQYGFCRPEAESGFPGPGVTVGAGAGDGNDIGLSGVVLRAQFGLDAKIRGTELILWASPEQYHYGVVHGDEVYFSATGITDGLMLHGVRYHGDYVDTQSMVLRYETGTRRIITTEHRLK